jgi:hypothetical protein
MATEPSFDATGALAIKPPRENIFTRPRAANNCAERRGPAGIFAAAAARAPLDDAAPPVAGRGAARHRLTRWSARAIAVAAVGAAIAALTARPTPDGAWAPTRAVSKQSTPSRVSSRPPVRRRQPSRARGAARRVHRARRSPAPKRASNRRPASRKRAPSPVVHVVPAAPAAPIPRVRVLPRGGTGPVPKRVPAGAPPEFM